jgi:uncharacterized protein (TIGR03435 family)
VKFSSWLIVALAVFPVSIEAKRIVLAVPASVAFDQAPRASVSFDVASVRPSQREVGPDYNNQITYSTTGIAARNVTLKRLIAEAYHVQLNQISGPGWLDRSEYEVEAKAAGAITREQMALMLRSLLTERFKVKVHSETREMRAYELAVGKSGPRIRPMNEGEAAGPSQARFHFRGDMRQFADLLAVQLSIPAPVDPSVPSRASGPPIPVLDKTGLQGTYDFSVDIHPELGTDPFISWQRALQDQLGLTLENRKENVEVLVVDEAEKTPTEN